MQLLNQPLIWRNFEKCISSNYYWGFLDKLSQGLFFSCLCDLAEDLSRGVAVYKELVHFVVQELAWISYIDSSLYFVSCQYPYLNPCIFHKLYSISYTVLQFIFNSSWTNKMKVLFYFNSYFIYFFFSALNSKSSFLVLFIPCIIILLA
jgi:hypothetical protein